MDPIPYRPTTYPRPHSARVMANIAVGSPARILPSTGHVMAYEISSRFSAVHFRPRFIHNIFVVSTAVYSRP